MIQIQSYPISKVMLTNEVLGAYINKFWVDIFTSIAQDNKHLMLMCKVEFDKEEMGYRTLGHLRRVNFDDKELFVRYLIQRLGLLTEGYTSNPISKISFTYIIKSGLAGDNDRSLLQDLSNKAFAAHRFNNMNLPISMNPEDYGTILVSNFMQIEGDSIHRFIVKDGSRNYQIDVSSLVNKVTILGDVDLSWIDTKISNDLFKREIGKSVMYFMDGVRVLSKKQLSAKPFTKLSTDKTLVNKFVTMDIETIRLENKITPYLICAYNGTEYITVYANESLNQDALFSSFVYSLLTLFPKGSNTLTVYAHNLSGFDGIFLLKHLLQFGKVEPLLFNGKLMSINIKLDIKGFTGKKVVFKDSYLLLPLSLRNLCKAFNISIPKGYFPFNLTNIFYAGLIPTFECWSNISLEEYNVLVSEFRGQTWNFEVEAIKYCKLDCKVLHEILIQFNELIFNHFNVNIYNSITLPALAMRIFKSQFMPKNTIYQLLGPAERDIRDSYTGGAVDVYIPTNRITSLVEKGKALFNKLYYYDVNSLYPFVMAKLPMPIGKPIAFEGDIRLVEPNAFGFFYCNISSPANLIHPILQRRIKTNEGVRTIAGLGSWTGWMSSIEMDNAIKFGYTFEIIKGYQFEKGYIFKDYIEKMYELRLQFEKGHPMNLIAKLLMNSLYGKFAMKLESTVVEMFNTSIKEENDLLHEMLDAYGTSVQDYVQVDNHLLTIRQSMLDFKYNQDEDMFHGLDVNIAVASSITAAARVWMSLLKNNSKFNLYYSDTDSIVIDRALPDNLLGNELGQVKLENTIKKAVFLAPKVYALITEEGREIIKVKGLSKEIKLTFSDLEGLLIKDSTRIFTQEKWFKSIINSEITTSDIIYTLKTNSNKREAIYINRVFNSTKPFVYNDLNNH